MKFFCQIDLIYFWDYLLHQVFSIKYLVYYIVRSFTFNALGLVFYEQK